MGGRGSQDRREEQGRGMRSFSGIGRVAAVGAVVAAIALVAARAVRRRGRRLQRDGALPERRPAREGQPRAGGWGAGGLRERHPDRGRRSRRDRARDRRRARAAARGHARGDSPVLSVGPGQPLRRSEPAPAQRERDPGRRPDRHRPDRDAGRPRRALQHAGRGDAPLPEGVLQGLGRPVPGQGRPGQPGFSLPEPGALHLQPALQRADQGHPAARALPRRQLAAGDRARRAPRRPRGPGREPERDDARAGGPEGRAGRVDRPPARLHAPREYDLRQRAFDPRPCRSAGRRIQAGGEAPAALPLAGSGLRRRRGAHRARPEPHDPSWRPGQ